MKKTFLKKTISAVVVAATMFTLIPLGVSAEWKKASNNTSSYIDGNQKVNGWKKISDKWYHFDCNGTMNIGWIKDNGKWYYADSTGAIQVGLIKINGKTYYFNKSGEMQTGTVTIGGKTYTFDKNGQAVGTTTTSKPINNQDTTVQQTPNNNQSVATTPSNNQGSNKSGITTQSNATSTNGNSVDVNGLAKLPQKYPINVQASAENKILELMNQKRTEAGLKPLIMDNTLLQVARYKSDHMIQLNYFDHTTPDGTKWVDWLQTIGYKYTTTGENIAYNTTDPVELFTQWWNSPGHRANMMNPDFGKVGIGVIQGDNKFMGTQTFSN
ncbi:CAP domain-containing protein [Clostridium uliginosum]|uniref:Uncharacterized conserved protein YkwD, contains CAP (CSP/antigen 5/PR1) domain n=1 Tax=Clostridium uliginosum TaxID=119641 RepID=A0A1I1JJR3_9CLOT|nr:CAP domain-containing protein [Clostridium uliginosum]SFC48787.1 Uncharacterized conserved protein YkwD, contains CAP (CSP/antigen 5/PR1) domain [Clostridium uliginosum]